MCPRWCPQPIINSTAHLAGNPDLLNTKTRAVLTPTHLSDPHLSR